MLDLHPWIGPLVLGLMVYVVATVGLFSLYLGRHLSFTLNRLFGHQRHPFTDIEEANWPKLTVLIPAHDEEAVVADAIKAVLAADYPIDRLQIIVINDRSRDGTGTIIDAMAALHPGRLTHYRRTVGQPGKGAALADALEKATGAVVVVFDADYIPGRGLLKALVAPFFDPTVGATMGRVIPINARSNLVTQLLNLERVGGYQVDQQARLNLGLIPHFGGTVGGLRMAALAQIGGWRTDAVTEDADITYRLYLMGWRVAYVNRAECYEEVPESWPVRYRQVLRWGKGHNQCMLRYLRGMLRDSRHTGLRRLEGFLLLAIYNMPLLWLGSLAAFLILFHWGAAGSLLLTIVFPVFLVVVFTGIGNFAPFFEIGAAAYLDRRPREMLALPFLFLSFLVNVIAVTLGTLQLFGPAAWSDDANWVKTQRYRRPTNGTPT